MTYATSDQPLSTTTWRGILIRNPFPDFSTLHIYRLMGRNYQIAIMESRIFHTDRGRTLRTAEKIPLIVPECINHAH